MQETPENITRYKVMYLWWPMGDRREARREPRKKIEDSSLGQKFISNFSSCPAHFINLSMVSKILYCIKDTWYLRPENDCKRDFYAVSMLWFFLIFW